MDFELIILNIIQKYGIKSLYTIFTIASSYMLFKLLYKWINNKLGEKRKIPIMPIKQIDLFNHPLFQKLRTYLNYEINHLVIGEPLREAIFRDFLVIKFTCIRDGFLRFLEKGSLERMDSDTYQSRILECIDEIIKNYEEEAIKEGIPEIVLIKFNEWHKDRISAIYDFLRDIHDAKIFTSNTARTYVVFDFIVHILNMTVLDAKRTLVNLNGELNKLEYKGVSSQKHKRPTFYD